MSHIPADTENTNFTDCPPVPLLFVEALNESVQKKICRKYSLTIEKFEQGYLLKSSETKKNFKFSFLDLFFSGLEILKYNPQSSFFIFEKNQLKEELETGIAGNVSKETSIDFQIRQWSDHRAGTPNFPEFSFSGFAQATLCQVGLFNSIQQHVVHLNYEQLMATTSSLHKIQFKESA
jgi:hypothetical protein